MGILLFTRPALYFPHSGTWDIMWNVATSGSVTSCVSGAGNSAFPVGTIDRDGDWRTDFVTFTAPTYGGSGSLAFQNSNGGNCFGAITIRSNTAWDRPRMRPFGVHDITGDGKPDIILLDPDSMTFYWARSESDYATQNSRTLGDQRSVPL
jgi:hypothetical protein